MAQGDSKDIALTAGITGADDIAKAAPKALSPWESGAKKVGSALQGAFAGVAQDVAKLVTVANAISLDKAFESAKKYRSEIGILSSTAGPVAQLRAQIGAISQAKLIRESELVAADRGLGRVVYSSKDALLALGDLGDEAQATGETLSDKLPLGAALMNGLGVAGAKVGDELGRVRTLADNLGTSGGLLAAEDRLTAMSALLSEIGTKTDGDRAKLEALALGLGRGLTAEQGKKAAAGIIGYLAANRRNLERYTGAGAGALSDEQGNLNVGAAIDAAQKLQQYILRTSKGKRGLAQLRAANEFGGDYHAGSAFLSADFDKIRAEAARAKPSVMTKAEAAGYRIGEAGSAERHQQEAERNARDAAEKLLGVSDKIGGMMASHPILGGLGANLGIKLAGAGLGGLAGKIFGGKGGGALEGAGALGSGGAGGAPVFVTNWPGGFGGGGEGTGLGGKALTAGKGLLAAGGADGLLGSSAAAIAAPLGFLAAAAAFAGKSLSELGEASKVHQGFDVVAISPEAAAEKAAKAKAADEAARGERSSGMQSAFLAETERIAKQRGGGDREQTYLEARKLGADADDARDIASRVEVKVVIENHSESPLTVNGQQGVGGIKN